MKQWDKMCTVAHGLLIFNELIRRTRRLGSAFLRLPGFPLRPRMTGTAPIRRKVPTAGAANSDAEMRGTCSAVFYATNGRAASHGAMGMAG